jgi:hypothetical protein
VQPDVVVGQQVDEDVDDRGSFRLPPMRGRASTGIWRAMP